MRTLAQIVVLIFLLFVPASCMSAPIGSDEKVRLQQEVEAQVRDGLLSRAEGDALREQIDKLSKGSIDWESLGYIAGGILAAAVPGAAGIVRLMRGPAKPMDQSQAQVLREIVEERRKPAAGEPGEPGA